MSEEKRKGDWIESIDTVGSEAKGGRLSDEEMRGGKIESGGENDRRLERNGNRQ